MVTNKKKNIVWDLRVLKVLERLTLISVGFGSHLHICDLFLGIYFKKGAKKLLDLIIYRYNTRLKNNQLSLV